MPRSLVRATVSTPRATSTRGAAFDQWLLRRLPLRGIPVEVSLGAGTIRFGDEPLIASVAIRDRGTLVRLLWNPDMAFGEAYRAGRIEVRGDLVELLERVFRREDPVARAARVRRVLAGDVNTPARSRDNVHHHYDLGNDFYRLWLDRELVYTCAYFPSPTDDLETAQRAKMHHVCRKLQIRPGDRVVEAGCGWGALAIYMAQQFGARVRAFNLSGEQIRYARERAEQEGLSGQVEFIEDDYRSITGRYDVFVSIGMLEHVGRSHYAALGRLIHQTLAPEGRGLVHFIGRTRPQPLSPWIRRRIFPGAYPPTLDEVIREVLAPWDLSVLDVENLRLHYALTLEHWRRRFEAHEAGVRAMFDEPFVRTWRLYLASSQAAFRSGALQLFQVLFAPGRSTRVAWRREA